MRRGFLLDKSKAKKQSSSFNPLPNQLTTTAAESGRSQARSEPEGTAEVAMAEEPRAVYRIQLPYGKVEESLPTDFTPDWNITIDTARGIIKSERRTLVLVTVPPKGSKMAVDESDHTEWITLEATKPRVFNAPGFPKLVPRTTGRPAYEVKTTPNMGMGVFATRDIKFAELVFAERPLIVAPVDVNALNLRIPNDVKYSQFIMDEYEKVLEAAVNRMSSANQMAFKSLMNSHIEDGSGPLLGVIRTNGYVVDKIYDGSGKGPAGDSCRYTVIGNVASRLNHSCLANVIWTFDLATFAFTFYAKQDIKAGEQLFYAYCDIWAGVDVRKRQLAPYGVVCECNACTNATPERDRFREEYLKRARGYGALNVLTLEGQNLSWPTMLQFQELVKFHETVIEEGLQNSPAYRFVLEALVMAYGRKGMRAKAAEVWDMLTEFNVFNNRVV